MQKPELRSRKPATRAAGWALSFLAIAACLGGQTAAADDKSIAMLPGEFTLSGREARQTLLVEEVRQGLFAGQLTENVTLTSSDPNIIRIENGVAVPVANGQAEITATAGERVAAAKVTVSGQEQPHQWNFRIHVQSVLSKSGCNSGACHGAAAGKNGFKLSLRGYDPEYDFLAITRQSRGRRIVPGDPGHSLVLMKPSGAIPHKGGLRFQPDSIEYRAIAEWIAAGSPGPTDGDPRLERLEVLPAATVLQKGSSQQLLVRAHFSDGHSEDVTRWAKYTSTNFSVASVDDHGRVDVTGNGEGAVVAWYLSNNVVASVSVPYENDVPPAVFAESERHNFIDDLVLDKLKSLNVPPSPSCTDAEYLRRAYLDTIGVLPTADETRAFLSDASADKRAQLADYLLTRPEFVDYWTYKWSDLLLASTAKLKPKALESYHGWIRAQVAENAPWDKFVREIVTARGNTLNNGAANFYALHEDPLSMSETVSMAFLGTSIACAHCHDHPLEKWTNDQYYGMANLFARVRAKGGGDGDRAVFTVGEGELIQPRTGHPQPPRPLDAEPLPFDATQDRRVYLADWLTSPENAYFGRAIVNRVWANFMGVGIVQSVDDMRLTNPPSNAKLLAALSSDLVKNDYNLKTLMRSILTSAAYQRSSRTTPGNEADERLYSRYYPKRLPAEVLLDALSQASGTPTKFKDQPAGKRALQLADSRVESYFLTTFGRPDRVITCECERSNDPSMVQVLHIMNGQTVNEKLAAAGSRVDAFLSANKSDAEIVDEVYLAALSRLPADAEKSKIVEVLADIAAKQKKLVAEIVASYQQNFSRAPTAEERKSIDALAAGEKRLVLEDLFWSVLSSKEFLFNH